MKIDQTMVWGALGLVIGYMLAKSAAKGSASNPVQSNEIEKVSDWWTYAGSWS